jgi:oligopeptide transport system ATP-binding protein
MVKYISDRVAVMHQGKIVELANSDELYAHALHPYTKSLLSAIPLPDPRSERIRKRITYDYEAHNYNESNLPEWVEIKPKHFIYASPSEVVKYKTELGI